MVTYQHEIDKEHIEVDWFLAKHCEKNCSYCIARYDIKRNISGDIYYDDSSLEKDEYVFNKLLKLNNVTISIFGGEPTTHPKGIEYFNALCSKFKDSTDSAVALLSHGDIPYDKINMINTTMRNSIFFITYHPSQVKNFDDYFEKIKLISSKVKVVMLFIIGLEETSIVKNKINRFLEYGIICELRPFIDKKFKIEKFDFSIFDDEIKKSDDLLDILDVSHDLLKSRPIKTQDNISKVMDTKEYLNGLDIQGKVFCKLRHFTIDENHRISIGCGMKTNYRSEPLMCKNFDDFMMTSHFVKCTKDVCPSIHAKTVLINVRNEKNE